MDHLTNKIKPDQPETYYKEINIKDLDKAKREIDKVLNEALVKQEITQKEFNAITTKEKGPGKFYQLFKVQKAHDPPNLPQGRPITSGCGSITENLSLFVDHHAKHLVPEIPSFLQDTPDLLRHFQSLNTKQIPPNAFPVSIDVTGLYSNIPLTEGIKCFEDALNTRKYKTIPTSLLLTLLTLVLTLNIFKFGDRIFQQLMGTAMGTRVAPTFANIFMAMIDTKISNCGKEHIHLSKRFIDDVFIIWTDTEEQFLNFMDEINNLHDTIKFTHSYDLNEKSMTFLDMTIKIAKNQIVTDLYRKPTDKIQY
jgi:hypothetical protein